MKLIDPRDERIYKVCLTITYVCYSVLCGAALGLAIAMMAAR